MIILILGGVGSGKTLTCVKEIVSSNNYAFTNFRLKNLKYTRLKYSDIIKETEKKDGNKTKLIENVNWEYWEKLRKKHTNYSVYLDELHNLIHARRSMSKTNILVSKWLSQIRKILQDSPTNHLYGISQTITKIDKDLRDLANVIIQVNKIEKNGKVYIIETLYDGLDCYMYGQATAKRYFLGNPYFNYYDTQEMVRFTDAEEFI